MRDVDRPVRLLSSPMFMRNLRQGFLDLQQDLKLIAFASPSLRRQFAAGATCKRCNLDRKSTRLNSSHPVISYAGFFLKKKKKIHPPTVHGFQRLRPTAS